MSRGKLWTSFIASCMLIVLGVPGLYAFPGGVADADEEYGCADDCHKTISSSVIDMEASETQLTPGESVSVTVTITGGEADGAEVGVMIISSLSPTGSLPSDAGWTIVSDPHGTTYNYVQIESYTGSATLTWELQAPSSEGIYTLYAKELHGDGAKYVNEDTSGVTFIVGEVEIPATGGPLVMITSPSSQSNLSGEVTIAASVISDVDIAYAILKIDCVIIDNKSSSPFSWTVNTESYIDGIHTINITVVDSEGGIGYRESTMTINNSEKNTEMFSWIVTMVVGSIAIVAALGVLIVAALLIRRRVMAKRGG